MSWLRRFLKDEKKAKKPPQPGPSEQPVPAIKPQQDPAATHNQAKEYLTKVQHKIERLAGDFAAGKINRAQFQELYGHYQREVRMIETVLETNPQSWQDAVTEGKSIHIRQQHSARAKAYAIYENTSGMSIVTLGNFEMDPDLFVPMLSSYRSATREIFGAGMRSTQIEGGNWVCFVQGELTTMIGLFTNEPSGRQLLSLEELHKLFEQANRPLLSVPPINPNELLFPHEYFLGHWRK